MTIARNVDFILKTKGLSRSYIEKALGVTKANLQRQLHSDGVALRRVEEIANILNTTAAELVADPPLDLRGRYAQKSPATKTELVCPSCGRTLKVTVEE